MLGKDINLLGFSWQNTMKCLTEQQNSIYLLCHSFSAQRLENET